MSSGFANQRSNGGRGGSRGFGGGGSARGGGGARGGARAAPVETNATAVRKSEVNELRVALNNAINSRDGKAIYSSLERVLAAMTIGLDVSDLFHNVIMASHTQDLIQKKMVYIYLTHYAAANESLALLAVNSIVRDTHDDNPMIRGLALRYLCSMRTPSLIEHMIDPLKAGLVDVNNYVRRNATLGCAKLFLHSPEVINDPGIVNKLYELLRDQDPAVILNAIRALQEILVQDGGMALNQRIVLHLISKLDAFNEWGQATVLDLLQNYEPEPDDVFSIMNLLDNLFKSRNTGLVMATVQIFLSYTQNVPDVHQHVFHRIKNPILALMITAIPEAQYTILSHLLLILKRVPHLFSDEYKHFYTREADPEYLKLLKVEVMQAVATEQTAKDIVLELSSYTTSQSMPILAEKSVQAIGRLAMKYPFVSETCLEELLSFLELEQIPVVMETTLEVMNDVLRRFPDSAVDIIPRLAPSLDIVDAPAAVAAIISMLGDYGELIPDAPYVLEELVDGWEEKPGKVKSRLLVGVLKLFFKRPLEMKPILGKMFVAAIDDFSDPDVHDRALFLYRILSQDPDRCKKVVTSTSALLNLYFVEEQDGLEVDRLFEEFNSLSIVYRQPSERFIKTEADFLAEEEQYAEDEAYYEGEYDEEYEEETYDEGNGGGSLLDSFSSSTPAPSPASGPSLNPSVSITPPTFESNWKTLPLGAQVQMPYAGSITDAALLNEHFARNAIKSVAQGANGPLLRFFLYCEFNTHLVLLELGVHIQQMLVSINIKSGNMAAAESVKEIITSVLSTAH
eukprot:TRINITY_DN5797_c0_g1_i1.p1 TRINITY_DN5797_c0_g1~~TRINITY_DN5797_c0_g1_i1.p1  ORF type:complete len:795 (-),score=223.86 TRINITY_DN5797_c0_g1_i1:143-2527(-)